MRCSRKAWCKRAPGEFSAVSDQLLAISDQRSAISGQRSAVRVIGAGGQREARSIKREGRGERGESSKKLERRRFCEPSSGRRDRHLQRISAFGLDSAISAPSALNNKPVRQDSLFFFAFFAVKDLQPSSAGY
jgi:hypothetical protein